MFKFFSADSTRRYIDTLDCLVDRYNNTKHSSIKMTPVEASKNECEHCEAFKNFYGDDIYDKISEPKFI